MGTIDDLFLHFSRSLNKYINLSCSLYTQSCKDLYIQSCSGNFGSICHQCMITESYPNCMDWLIPLINWCDLTHIMCRKYFMKTSNRNMKYPEVGYYFETLDINPIQRFYYPFQQLIPRSHLSVLRSLGTTERAHLTLTAVV